MSNVTYSAGNLTITVAGLDTVEQALGDLKRKTPAAAKVAINATARQARKLMVAKAKTRYAVNAAGRRHLKDLVQRKKASNSSLMAELHIAKMRNDLGYFKTSPAVPTHFTGMDFKDGPSVWKAKVLKSSGMKTLPGAGGMSKGFGEVQQRPCGYGAAAHWFQVEPYAHRQGVQALDERQGQCGKAGDNGKPQRHRHAPHHLAGG